MLLKNEAALPGEARAVLPLQPGSSVAVIGAFAERPRYQGAGSSSINAARCEAPLAATLALTLTLAATLTLTLTLSRCETPLAAIRAAVEAAGGSVSYAAGYEPLCAGDDPGLTPPA